ncbi:CAAD domain-containing protein [Phormidesmis sp. 146-35]
MSTNTENIVEVKTETTIIDIPTGDSIPFKKTTVETPSKELIEAKTSEFLSDPINYSAEFLKPYLPILKAVGWVLLAAIGLNLLLTVLGGILSVATSIPILSPLFELVGIIYVGWFVYHNLLTASQQQEFSQKVAKLKKEVIGEVGEILDADKSEIS